jgi:hypothetical protein
MPEPTVNPDGSHDDVGGCVYIALIGLCGCPDMMGQVGGATGEIVGIEEGERETEGGGHQDREHHGQDGMSCRSNTGLGKGMPDWMLGIELGGTGCAVAGLALTEDM